MPGDQTISIKEGVFAIRDAIRRALTAPDFGMSGTSAKVLRVEGKAGTWVRYNNGTEALLSDLDLGELCEAVNQFGDLAFQARQMSSEPAEPAPKPLKGPLQVIRNLMEANLSTLIKKNADYAGAGTDFFHNFVQCEQLGICSVEEGMLVRMTDKLSRAASLLKPGATQQVSDESVLDTLQDLSNYALLLVAYRKQKQGEVSVDWAKVTESGKVFIPHLGLKFRDAFQPDQEGGRDFVKHPQPPRATEEGLDRLAMDLDAPYLQLVTSVDQLQAMIDAGAVIDWNFVEDNVKVELYRKAFPADELKPISWRIKEPSEASEVHRDAVTEAVLQDRKANPLDDPFLE